jgi:hypothetical protein
MAKGQGPGQTCPSCQKRTYRNQGSYCECTLCGCIGWSSTQSVSGVGKGRGSKCPDCGKQTLHVVKTLSTGQTLRRCATCKYNVIEPPSAQAATLQQHAASDASDLFVGKFLSRSSYE